MRLRNIRKVTFALFCACAVGSSLTGCSKDAEFSQKEAEQFKQGPPKEMSPVGKKLFEDAQKAGRGPAPSGGQPAGAGK